MAREFLTRNQDDDDDHLMQAIASREAELACYDCNVDIYCCQIESMGEVKELPPTLASLKGKTNEQLIAMGVTTEHAELAAEFNHCQRVKMLHFTEQAERRKSEMAYQALLEKLPAGERRDRAMKRYVDKKEAQKAKP